MLFVNFVTFDHREKYREKKNIKHLLQSLVLVTVGVLYQSAGQESLRVARMDVSWGAVSVLSSAILAPIIYLLWPTSNSGVAAKRRGVSLKKKQSAVADEVALYSPGLRNVGNSCFLNSTLQALASCREVVAYLDALLKRPHKAPAQFLEFDEELLDVLLQLNETYSYHKTISPVSFIETLRRTHREAGRSLGYFQEDAHELFQMVAALVVDTHTALAHSPLPSLASFSSSLKPPKPRILPSCPLLGMVASAINCTVCGRFGKLRHTTISHLSLIAPSFASMPLESLAAEYTAPCAIEGMRCDYCSLLATKLLVLKKIDAVKKLAIQSSAKDPRSSKEQTMQRSLLSMLEKQLAEIEASLQYDAEAYMENAGESGILKTLVPKKVIYSKLGYKQTLIAKCPKTLVIHISRSLITPSGHIVRNPCRITFPQVLDVSPYCAGELANSARDRSYFSRYRSFSWKEPEKAANPSSNPVPTPKELYRLNACVMHYGAHDSGHFVCYRRLYQSSTSKESRWIRCSDESLRLVENPSAEIFKNGQSDIYMLYYSKI